jgi:hypothetical protein
MEPGFIGGIPRQGIIEPYKEDIQAMKGDSDGKNHRTHQSHSIAGPGD